MTRIRLLEFSLQVFLLGLALAGLPEWGGRARAQSTNDVLIHELMVHPGVGEYGDTNYVAEDTRAEFIEFYNRGTGTVPLANWRISSGVSFVFPDVALAPGAHLVVAATEDVDWFRAHYRSDYPAVDQATVVGGWTGTLANNGEAVELQDAAGRTVDRLEYATEGDWAERATGDPYPGQPEWWRGWKWTTGADAGGRSFELVNSRLPGRYGQNWSSSRTPGGTPGGANSVAASDVAPLILEVRHTPAIPRSTDEVWVTARIVDEEAANLVVHLRHRQDSSASFDSTLMLDDGQQGDGGPGDGRYGARLPAAPDRTIVEFYVEAQDASGKTRTWPGPAADLEAQVVNALYQVDDAVYEGSQAVYRLVIPTNDWANWTYLMDSVSRGQFSDAEMNGTLILSAGMDADIRYRAAVRNRGAGTRSARPHNLHVAIPNDHSWDGRTKFSLNTRTVHSQVAGNALWSLAGLPNTYGAPVQVRVNGTNLAHATPTGSTDSFQFGSYFAYEPYNREWSDRHLPLDPNGNLYGAVWYLDGVRLQYPADLRYLGEDPAVYRMRYGPDGPTSETGSYFKQSNVAADDWTDLIRLTRTLNETTDAEYLAAVESVVHVDEWLRYFAVNSLGGNMETTLATGAGDDYSLHGGMADPRFLLLTHDLDTTLGQGDTSPDYSRSVFRAANIPAIRRLLEHPAIAPRYYATLLELTDGVFRPDAAAAVIDQWTGGWVTEAYRSSMKDFVARRRDEVLAQIPLSLTVSNALPISGGYPVTAVPAIGLSGRAHAVRTRSVRVNAAAAEWTAWSATWSAPEVFLSPGINRLLIQALDDQGIEIERTTLDVWYDRGQVTVVPGGELEADTHWSAATGPYLLETNLTVPPGRTLQIDPGTTVYLPANVQLLVRGRLDARGTPGQRIRFTRPPGSGADWAGIRFENTAASNLLTYADLEFAAAGTAVVQVTNAQVALDHITIGGSATTALDFARPQATVRHSTFGDVGAHLLMRVGSLASDGWLEVEDNVFGTSDGGLDVARFERSSVRGGPLPRLRRNLFLGGSGNLVNAAETDLLLDGNYFQFAGGGVENEDPCGAVVTSPASGAGPTNRTTQHLVLTRNTFFGNDHACVFRTGAYAEIAQSVFVGNRGAIRFDVPQDPSALPARGALIENCLFWENQSENAAVGSGTLLAVQNRRADGASHVHVRHTLLPADFHAGGEGNIEADPRLVRPTVERAVVASLAQFGAGWEGIAGLDTMAEAGFLPDLRLAPESPARGAGENGVDLGSQVGSGVSIQAVVPDPTARTSLELSVGGVEVAGFRYRLVSSGFTNAWSGEQAPRRSVQSIQCEASTATVVAPGHGLAAGDLVEIRGAEQVAYDGVFAVQQVLSPDAFAVSVPGSPSAESGAVDIWCQGRRVIRLSALTAGEYRLEAIGRDTTGVWQDDSSPTAREWAVDPHARRGVRLHEVLAQNTTAVPAYETYPDLVELHHEGTEPVDLGGMGLTDDAADPYRFQFPAGTMVLPDAYLVLYGDSAFTQPGLHLGFGLNRTGDRLLLFASPAEGGGLVDSVSFGLQVRDLSLGRRDDGSWVLCQPTFGAANVPQDLGSFWQLRLNEWLARGLAVAADDFLELYNPEPLPVALEDLYLTDHPPTWPLRHRIAPLSFIPAQGHALFVADGQTNAGPDHVSFALAADGGMLGLFAPDGRRIDAVIYGPQRTDVSEGRSPSGSPRIVTFDSPSPGGANAVTMVDTNVVTITHDLVSMTNVWRYYEAGDPGPGWADPDFADGAWPSGRALLGDEDEALPAPIHTPLTLGQWTYYFRTPFEFPTNPAGFHLLAETVIDDGAVIHLNGHPINWRSVPTNWTHTTAASATVGDADLEGPFELPADGLVVGTNLLAVEVHQVNLGSSDVVFGLRLRATRTVTNQPPGVADIALNEICAHNVSPHDFAPAPPDWIELYNRGSNRVDLAGLSLSDDLAEPRRFVFPEGAAVAPHGYLVITCDGERPASATNTGFGLAAKGGNVFLADRVAAGGQPLDTLAYGWQLAGFTLGRSLDGSGSWTLTRPTPGTTNSPATTGDPSLVRINEWMADPDGGDDWLELFNPGVLPVDLSGFSLSDDPGRPALSPLRIRSFLGVGADAFVQLIADGSPSEGFDHLSFRLAGSGESVWLNAPSGMAVDSVSFGLQTEGVSEGRLPDGASGAVRFPGNATPGESNYLPLPGIVVNEVLSHTDPPFEDAIELANTSDQDAPVGGWYLSNAQTEPRKYRVPDGTSIPARGYGVFYEAQFNGGPGSQVPFTLNAAHGDQVWLSATDAAGNLTGYRAVVAFGAAANGVSFGRHATSLGVDFVPLASPTFGADAPATVEQFRQGTGAANASPVIGPIVLHEIHCEPLRLLANEDNTIDEFIEFCNASTAPVPLFDPDFPANTWRLGGAVSYQFPAGWVLAGNAYALVVPFDPVSDAAALAAFRNRFGVPAGVPVFGPLRGKLGNVGETIRLYRPDTPQAPPHPDAGFVPYILVDQVRYGTSVPWPANVSGTGNSLQRLASTLYGNEPLHWMGAPPTPGRANGFDSDDANGDGLPDAWQIQFFGQEFATKPEAVPGADPDHDGMSNLQEHLGNTSPIDPASVLMLVAQSGDAGQTILAFTTAAALSYTIQQRDSLNDGAWSKLADVPVQSAATRVEVTDTHLGATARFYRVVTPIQP